MKIFTCSLFLLFLISSCASIRSEKCKKEEYKYHGITIVSSEITAANTGIIKGILVDENGEALIGGQVFLKETNNGSVADLDGRFEISRIEPGSYTLVFSSIGYTTIEVTNFEIKVGECITLETKQLQSHAIELKPIIYCYPKDTTALSIQLDYDGTLLHTYPEEKDGKWELTAYPDGTLIDGNGRTYYSIYWEGITNHEKTIDEGYIVSRSETISFLEEKLAELGLTEREANEFIIFWLPILNKNELNFIHFDTSHYIEHAALNVEPKPETMIRIMMLHCPATEKITIPTQILPKKPTRSGFTIVEWGGKKIELTAITL